MATKTQTPTERILTLQAEQKRIAAELREAESGISPLDKVIARQGAPTARTVNKLAARVRARIDAGQERDEALDAVLATYRVAIETALETEAES